MNKKKGAIKLNRSPPFFYYPITVIFAAPPETEVDSLSMD